MVLCDKALLDDVTSRVCAAAKYYCMPPDSDHNAVDSARYLIDKAKNRHLLIL